MQLAAAAPSTHEIADAAAQLAEACRRLHARGLLAGMEGNLSSRLADGTLLITASGVDKATMTARHVLRCHADGTKYHEEPFDTVTSGTALSDRPVRPSSELEMHVGIYQARPDVRAVVHAHPPVSTGFATAGRALAPNVLPEVPVVVGPVALVPYARPGTPALFAAIRPFVANHEVFQLANHGVTVVGSSLEDAVARLESVEQAARILLVAELLGGPRLLDPDEAAALRALWPSP